MTKESTDLYVGMKLYEEIVERATSYHPQRRRIEEVTVSKIGTKYFDIGEGFHTVKFDKTTLIHTDKVYSHDSRTLYRTEQEIHDKNEQFELASKICQHVNRGPVSLNRDYTLDQLKQIKEALGI